MARITCIGEAMLELSAKGDDWTLGFGGDTLNTAIHLSRCGHDISYLTALGDDPFSRDLRGRIGNEGIDGSLVLSHPSRHVGLYAITTDAAGERSFTYWRDASAAREMFALPGSVEACRKAVECDLLCFSLISLAILPPAGREALLSVAGEVRRRGGRVAFDANYRPALWASRDEAIAVRDAAIARADFGLPSFDDEAALSGVAGAAEALAHWNRLGCEDVVVKCGAEGCVLRDGSRLAPSERLLPVDSSGAGDAFDAGYLAARLRGAEPAQAALLGHRLAAWTIMRRGAVPPRDEAYPVRTD